MHLDLDSSGNDSTSQNVIDYYEFELVVEKMPTRKHLNLEAGMLELWDFQYNHCNCLSLVVPLVSSKVEAS